MAKPKKTKSGIFTLAVCFQQQRVTLTLGTIENHEAQLFAANMRSLTSLRRHQSTSQLPLALQSWIQTLTVRHRQQLSRIQLIDEFNSALTVDKLIDAFQQDYDQRDDIIGSTKTQFRSAMKRIPAMLKERLVSEIEPQRKHYRTNSQPVFTAEAKKMFCHVESWQREHYAKASWSRANGRLREVGVWAVRNGICDYNPFSELSSPGEVNAERNQHIEIDWVLDAMEQASDPDTRLLFVLGRFAGFRLLSEARTLKPGHIDWDNSTLRVFDSKKKEFRSMPLFDRVRKELLRHRDAAGWPGRFVLTGRTLNHSDSNATTLMKRSLKKTEHDQWPKFNQNLRSSCENDWLNTPGFTEAMVTRWIGHTIAVSRKHYQNETNSDRQRAVDLYG